LDDCKYFNNALYGYVDYWRDIFDLIIYCHCERSEAIPRLLNNCVNMDKVFCVYIATNYPRNTVLYTGVTNNIFNRENQHKTKINKNSFTARYNINRIVYYETFERVINAISREKNIKAGSRKNKIDLINSVNPEWKDLIEESYK